MTVFRIIRYAAAGCVCLVVAVVGAFSQPDRASVVGFVAAVVLAGFAGRSLSTERLSLLVRVALVLTLIAIVVGVVVAFAAQWGDADCTPGGGCGPPDWFSAIFPSMLAFDAAAALVVAFRGSLHRRRRVAAPSV